MSKINAVCVYCGSSAGTEPAFGEAAGRLGRILAENSVRLVYCGGSIGLMGILAESVLAHGGKVTGIIPEFLTQRERPRRLGQELIITRDMHERKRTMFDRADAFVALPGGIGTLEELVEQLTWAQLNRHMKPILIADIGGFWRPLLALLAHMRIEGFIREGFEARYLVAERIEDALPMLRAADWARIVTLSAHSIQRQNPRIVAYTASKAALSSVTKNLSKSLAKDGILVNCVCPGTIVTASFTEQLKDILAADGLDATNPHDVMTWIDNNFHQPCDLGRAGLPEEIASITTYLVSRRNGYVTGATVNVDGGSDFV